MYDNFFTFSILFVSIMSVILGIYSIIPTLLCFCGVTLLICLLLHALDFFYFSYLFLIIYVGAIAILFTYVIMLLNLHNIDVYARSKVNFHVITLSLLFFSYIYIFIYIIMSSSAFGTIPEVLSNFRVAVDDVLLLYFNKSMTDAGVVFFIFSDLQQVGFFLFYGFQLHIVLATLLLLSALFGVLILSSYQSVQSISNKNWISAKYLSVFKF